ncbi:MAG: hypothetical protein ACK5BY_02935 [Limnohabitans sp.]|jgi:hypothetical protein|uniref:hypothetical protein n=1 Tax=Limnohabitans sp. TaxID=1907725 RepID=UPI00391D2BEF
MVKRYDTSEDPIVQAIPWTINGQIIPVEITRSGKLLVDGSAVIPADELKLVPSSPGISANKNSASP